MKGEPVVAEVYDEPVEGEHHGRHRNAGAANESCDQKLSDFDLLGQHCLTLGKDNAKHIGKA